VLRALAAVVVLQAVLATPSVPVRPALADGRVRVQSGLVYGSFGGQPLWLDAYLPAGRGDNLPAMVLIHGGGWWSGNRTYPRSVAETLARKGWAAFSIGYTLDTPSRSGYPVQVEECQAALRWIERHAAEFHIDVHRLAVYGGSAGGYLASMLAVLGPGRPAYVPVAAAVSVSGPDDPALLVKESLEHYPCRPTGCAVTYAALNHLSWFLGCPLDRCSARLLREASPVYHVTRQTPPFFLYDSSDEIIPLSQATAMKTALQRAGIPVRLMVISGTSHGPPRLLDVEQPIAKFLAAYVLKGPAPVWPWALAAIAAAALLVASLYFLTRRRRPEGAPSEGWYPRRHRK
jgi:acetyl esterase/lipase